MATVLTILSLAATNTIFMSQPITNKVIPVENKSVMWRDFKFMTDVEKTEIYDRCGEI